MSFISIEQIDVLTIKIIDADFEKIMQWPFTVNTPYFLAKIIIPFAYDKSIATSNLFLCLKWCCKKYNMDFKSIVLEIMNIRDAIEYYNKKDIEKYLPLI